MPDKVSSPPPPSPLPLQPYTARARSALARFVQPFIYGYRHSFTRVSQAQQTRPARSNVQGSSSTTSSSRSTAHRTGIPIAAFDISPSRTHAILAGRDILKTIRVTNSACIEEYDLRAAIVAYAAAHETAPGGYSAKYKIQLVANDVKWSHGAFDAHIATAAANGQIVVYNIHRAGVELARLHEHNRQVHRLGFNPHQGAWMLSGSQDATVRLWDLRSMAGDRNVITCRSINSFPGNSGGIRDLRWSPTDGFEFAAGTDNGIVQHWDIRKPNAPVRKIMAHDMTCNSIDWHPDGKHLVSGGADKNIKVWDLSSSDRRMNSMWQLRAPQAVVNVRWRPVCWSTGIQRSWNWQCTQVATSYDNEDPRIHIWDFRRPSVPFRTLDLYDTPPAALLWHSESLLWFAGSTGIFTQSDIKFALKRTDHRSPNVVDIAPNGQILYCSMKKEQRRMSIEDMSDDILVQNPHRGSADKKPVNVHRANNGFMEGSGLFKNLAKTKSASSSTATPPLSGSTRPVVPLEMALHPKHIYKPSQVIATGYIPGLFDTDAFKFMARHYKRPPLIPTERLGYSVHVIYSEIFHHNAQVAAYAGQYCLSQTWEILGLAIQKELASRAEYSYNKRSTNAFAGGLESLSPETNDEDAFQKAASHEKNNIPANAQIPSGMETSSNISTPLARPMQDGSEEARSIPAFDKANDLTLMDHIWAKQPLMPVRAVSEIGKIGSPEPENRRTEGSPILNDKANFKSKTESIDSQTPEKLPTYGPSLSNLDIRLADRRAATENFRAIPRPVLRLDDPFHANSSLRPKSISGYFENLQQVEKPQSTPERHYLDIQLEQEADTSNSGNREPLNEELSSPIGSQVMPSLSAANGLTEIAAHGRVNPASSSSMQSFRPHHRPPPVINTEDIEPFPTSDQAEEVTFANHKYIESDFLLATSATNELTAPPWTATAMLAPLITYHCEKLFDAQFPSWLLIHLDPYFNMQMDRSRALGIILHYHKKLTTLGLFTQAAELRHATMDTYPEVSEYGTDGVDTGGSYCTRCRKGGKAPRNVANDRCDSCRKHWDECPICVGRGPVFPKRPIGIDTISIPAVKNAKAGDSLWGWCSSCGHGGHMGCLRVWWDDAASEGGCPTMGCMCDCVPGSRRDEINKSMETEDKTAEGQISQDERKAGEIGAVQRASGLVGGTESRKPGGKGILQRGGSENNSLSLGAAGRSAIGGKKVRIVIPEERWRDSKGGGNER